MTSSSSWLLLALTLTLPSPAAGAADVKDLQRRLEAIVARQDGVTGVAVLHVQDGRQAGVNAGERFPMHSVYKLLIGIAALDAVDRGKLRLQQPIEVRAEDVTSGPDPKLWRRAPQTVTLRRLVELMLGDSDNTACDRLLALLGGPAAVTRTLHDKGVIGVSVNRPERQIFRDFCATAPDRPCEKLSLAEKTRAVKWQLDRGLDVATPQALVAALALLQRGRLLSPASTKLLLSIMDGSPTGPARLRGLLPPGTPVAHKTGTGPLVVNDIGLVSLPGGRGQVAIAVLNKLSDRPREQRERTIAELGRATFDFFAAGHPAGP